MCFGEIVTPCVVLQNSVPQNSVPQNKQKYNKQNPHGGCAALYVTTLIVTTTNAVRTIVAPLVVITIVVYSILAVRIIAMINNVKTLNVGVSNLIKKHFYNTTLKTCFIRQPIWSNFNTHRFNYSINTV